MIVPDASALFQVLDRGGNSAAIEARLFSSADPLCTPHLVDAEIASILRKHVLLGRLSEARARLAMRDHLDLALVRFPHAPLLPRVFELRNGFSAYDALYVALAESLSAPLVTCDKRMARAAAGLIGVEVF